VLLRSGTFIDGIRDWERCPRGVDMWIFSELIVIARGSEYPFDFHSPMFVLKARGWLGKYFETRTKVDLEDLLWMEEYLSEDGKNGMLS